jgi:hypothetical protein
MTAESHLSAVATPPRTTPSTLAREISGVVVVVDVVGGVDDVGVVLVIAVDVATTERAAVAADTDTGACSLLRRCSAAATLTAAKRCGHSPPPPPPPPLFFAFLPTPSPSPSPSPSLPV